MRTKRKTANRSRRHISLVKASRRRRIRSRSGNPRSKSRRKKAGK